MSRKILLAFVVVMVCALAFSNAETPDAPSFAVDDSEPQQHGRFARASECTDAQKKECVKGCRVVNGKRECLP